MSDRADWKVVLLDIFAGYINQEPLQEGLEQLAQLATRDPGLHSNALSALDAATASAAQGSVEVLPIINRSGYSALDSEQAMKLLREVREIYLVEYNRIMGRP